MKELLRKLVFVERPKYICSSNELTGCRWRGLTGSTLHGQPLGGGAVYGFCDEVDSYYADLQRKGANVKAPPQDQPYGLRDFIVTDADGNRLSFGCETPEA